MLGAGGVPVQVRPGAICVEQAELTQSLKDLPNARGGSVVVAASVPRGLLVRTVWADGQSIERKIPADVRECPAVKRVVVTLIKAWIAAPPQAIGAAPRADEVAAGARRQTPDRTEPMASATAAAPPDPGPVAALRAKSAGPPLGAPQSGAPSVEIPLAAESRFGSEAAGSPRPTAPADPLPVAPSPTAPSATAASAAPEAGASPPAEPTAAPQQPAPAPAAEPAQEVAEAGVPEEPGAGWRLGVGALGGTTAGTTPEAAAAASFFAELDKGRAGLGVGVEGGLESARSVRSETAPGTLWAAQRWLTLYLKFGVPVGTRVTLSASLGIRGWQIEAGSAQVPNPRSTTALLGAGAALTVGAELQLGPIVLLVRGVGSARFPEERVTLNGNPTLLLKWWQVGALAGIGWHFP